MTRKEFADLVGGAALDAVARIYEDAHGDPTLLSAVMVITAEDERGVVLTATATDRD